MICSDLDSFQLLKLVDPEYIHHFPISLQNHDQWFVVVRPCLGRIHRSLEPHLQPLKVLHIGNHAVTVVLEYVVDFLVNH